MHSSRTYRSGFAKRKQKADREEANKKMKGSILKFAFDTSKRTGTLNESTTDVEGSLQSKCKTQELTNPGPASIDFKDTLKMKSDFSTVPSCDSATTDVESSLMLKDTAIDVEHVSTLQEYNPDPAIDVEDASTISTLQDYNPDPATWSFPVPDAVIEYFIRNVPPQNTDLISETKKNISGYNRCLTKNHFFRIKQNKEMVNRTWLVLSPTNKSLYCWVCKLFSENKTTLGGTGFSDWKHVTERLSEHEKSVLHRECIIKMSNRMQSSLRVDSCLVIQLENESNYWRCILQRVVATVKFLSQRGLAFFGENETFRSPHNGNFLGCIELIAEFDPFLASHINKYGNPGRGHANYLSSTCVYEFIDLMSKKVLNKITTEVISAKYFSIIVDCTPDITHLDQLCFIIRYVTADGHPIERFFNFIPVFSHSAEELAETIITNLENLGLQIENCRGQSYDNASNMSGKYTGVQARIKNLCQYAEFIPCSAHSLNLVGINAVESCNEVASFFGFLQELYNFFSSSTNRWQTLNENIKENSEPLTLKNRSTTRWCADSNATKALRKNYAVILKVLKEMKENMNQAPSTRCEARSLCKKIEKFETAVNTVVWDCILQRLNKTNKSVQKSTDNLSQVSPLFESLIKFVQYVRENFDLYEKEALELLPDTDYADFRARTVPQRFDSNYTNKGAKMTPRERFVNNCHYVLCDVLITQLIQRRIPYENVMKKFACLTNTKSPFLREEADALQQSYPLDIDENFSDELIQFSSFIDDETVPGMLKKMKELQIVDTFPNVETILRIFLTIPISNCSGERSFSLLKRLKSPNRSSVGQLRLSALALLCMENDITQSLNYDDIIKEFSELKIRKKPLKKLL
jgi:hypothetical protein